MYSLSYRLGQGGSDSSCRLMEYKACFLAVLQISGSLRSLPLNQEVV